MFSLLAGAVVAYRQGTQVIGVIEKVPELRSLILVHISFLNTFVVEEVAVTGVVGIVKVNDIFLPRVALVPARDPDLVLGGPVLNTERDLRPIQERLGGRDWRTVLTVHPADPVSTLFMVLSAIVSCSNVHYVPVSVLTSLHST